MQMKFTVNITEVRVDGVELGNRMRHYALFPDAFRVQYGDTEHELFLEDESVIMFEMEDIEVIP